MLRDLERVTYPSVLQRQTAYYNIACCRAKLGQSVEALDALETAFSQGFDDFGLVSREGDFDGLRGDVDRLVAKFKPRGPLANVAGALDGMAQPRGTPGGLGEGGGPLGAVTGFLGGLKKSVEKGVENAGSFVDFKD